VQISLKVKLGENGNMKANRKFVDSEEAVSAVIGVILMVAITVAIAATVYVYVSGMIGTQQDTTPNITIQKNDVDNTLLVTGADPSNAAWENINISVTKTTASEINYGWINLSSIQYDPTPGAPTVPNCPAGWGTITAGNTIYCGKYTVAGGATEADYTVSLRWIPTNTLVGTYTFNT
jgi:flagellin-like protein